MSDVDILLSQNRSSSIYLVRNGGSGSTVRKVLNDEFPSTQAVRRFYNEYDISHGLDMPGARRALDKHRWRGRHAMMLEYADGITVHEAFEDGDRSMEDFLAAAISVTSTLSDLHAARVIHNDISASNIVVDPDKGLAARIIDFGSSSRADMQQPYVSNPGRLRGNLLYISPEQTGRMNRVVDYRTDLYSAGVLFYFMLTGQHPFASTDPMELVHYHIAVTPPPPRALRSRVPEPLSDLVMKLLAKNAEDRYQSAHGVMADLARCRDALSRDDDIAPFVLAQDDSSSRFHICEKLYGREREVEQLLAAFDRVSDGALELVLVGGYSGTGKTALVAETHKPITARRGAFIRGKYDQFQRNIPYSAITDAFGEYVGQLLTLGQEALDGWRERIQRSVGAEGRVLTELMPNLELVIGEQPPVPELAGKESQNRFNYVFRNFVKAIARAGHPLVLFIDDLQWADSASLDLLRVLVTDRESSHLLCVLAYRDNEVSPSHPFIKTVDRIAEEGATIGRIDVGNLPVADASQLIADSLLVAPQECASLTRIVYDKTRGNAFFLRQFLMSLSDEGHLSYDYDARRWQWDSAAIEALDITDNVVELMAKKIRRLTDEVQRVLTLAACIGNRFDIEVLSLVSEASVEHTLACVDAAKQEGLVHASDQVGSFVHDRIQQAAYSLTPASERAALHLRIGRILVDKTAPADREERLFDMANQLNQGRELVTDRDERIALATLNLDAGRRAKASAGYLPACEYFAIGCSLLPDDAWQALYSTALTLWSERAETAYLSGRFEDMDAAIASVMEHAATLLDKVPAYQTRILAFKARNQLLDAIDAGLEVLSALGVEFPSAPTQEDTAQALANTQALLEGRTSAELLSLPEMTDPAMIAALDVIAGVNSSVYWARAELFPFMVFKAVELSVEHGNTATSAFGYSTYGVILSGIVGDMKRAYEFGLLGLDLVEKFGAREWLTQLYTPHYALIVHWNEHTRNTLKPLEDSYHIGLETGAIEYAVINANLYCIHSYLCGVKLEGLEKEIDAYSQRMLASKQETNYQFTQIYHQTVLNLLGRSEDPLRLVGEAYDEDAMLPLHLEANDHTASFFVYFNRFVLGYLFGDLDAAAAARDEAEARLSAILAKLENTVFNFYDSLLALALYPAADEAERAQHMARVVRNQETLHRWATDAPMNFRHKFLLVEAEKHRVLGEDGEAPGLYDRAIELARENQYLNEEALAFELAGKYYLGRGDGERAAKYLGDAYRVYQQWEARAKMKDLAARFPAVVTRRRAGTLGGDSPTLKTGSLTSSEIALFDMVSVLKAATAISEEIVLKRLLERLMSIILQSAGAQRGVLVLERDGRLFVEAEVSVDAEHVPVLQHVPVGDCEDLPHKVIQYVSRTRETVVIGDAATEDAFAGDEYLSANPGASVFCAAVVNQGRLLGLIYLENRLAPHAFTGERTELLSLLSGQIAISINNAIMFDELERLVAQRTASLEEANRELERLSNLDGLTELYNRRYFDHAIDKEWRRLRRDAKPLSLIFCDVDYFKRFNDSQGHLAGDDCLRKLAKVLRDCAKRPSDVAARYGGEEFVVLLPQTDRAGAEEVADEIRRGLAALAIPHPDSDVDPSVTLSFGICTVVPTRDGTATALVDAADRGLYRSKAAGRNRVTCEDYASGG